MNKVLKFAVLVLLSTALATSASAVLSLVEIDRWTLPLKLAGAADLRFEDGGTLLMSVRGVGVVRSSFSEGTFKSIDVLLPEGKTGGIVIPENLGASEALLAVSAPMSQLVWVDRSKVGVSGQLGAWGTPDTAPISFFEDIDVFGNKLAILGLMRSEHGMSPDGAVAWIGHLSKGEVTLEPLAYSKAGKGARPFDACSVFAVGKVRFLADGRLLLVPGAEPGVYLYNSEGKLLRTWDTSSLGLNLRCDFDDEKLILFNSDVHARLDYINRFSTVDEILPTEAGPAILIRWADERGTYWKMAVLGEDGVVEMMDVPVRSPSTRAHLRGDVLDGKILLVLREFLPEKGKTRERAELIELRIRPDERVAEKARDAGRR